MKDFESEGDFCRQQMPLDEEGFWIEQQGRWLDRQVMQVVYEKHFLQHYT